MVISKRLNIVLGRYVDSWARVIGGRLYLFVREHTIVSSRRCREASVTLGVTVYEIEWDEFKELEGQASFVRRQKSSARQHRFRVQGVTSNRCPHCL